MYSELSYPDSKMAKVLPPEGEIIADLPELIYTLREIASAAPEVDLPQLKPGLLAYAKVTEEVTAALDTDLFIHPEKMALTMPYFAKRAIDPFRSHVRGEREEVGVWSPLFYSDGVQNISPSIAMKKFLEIHILGDLHNTLNETNTQPKHKEDYKTPINKVLSDVAYDIAPDYIELNRFLKFIRADKIGMWAVLQYIYHARDQAWKKFEIMSTSREPLDDVDPRMSSPLEYDGRIRFSDKLLDWVIQHTTETPHHFRTHSAPPAHSQPRHRDEL